MGRPVVVEFGVKRGASSSALLLGADEVYSYDIKPTAEAIRLQGIVGARWHYQIKDSLEVEIPECGMLFIDSLHTYDQCNRELLLHADKVQDLIVCHDSITFGSIGADGESGRQQWAYTPGVSVPLECLGIRPAIDRLMIRDPTWHIAEHYVNSHGLLVLQRRR